MAANNTAPGQLPETSKKARNNPAITTKLKLETPMAIKGRQIRGNCAFLISPAWATKVPVKRLTESLKYSHGSRPAHR